MVTSFCTDAGTRLAAGLPLEDDVPGSVVAPRRRSRLRRLASAVSSAARSPAGVLGRRSGTPAGEDAAAPGAPPTSPASRAGSPRRRPGCGSRRPGARARADTCARAVRSETPSRSAICELSRPSTISSSTCLWRAVSACRRGCRRTAGDASYSNGELGKGAVLGQQGVGSQLRGGKRIGGLGTLRQHDHRHAGGRRLPQLGRQRRFEHDHLDAARQRAGMRSASALPDARAPAGEQGRERAHVQSVAPSYKQADACQTLVGFLGDGENESKAPPSMEEARPS